MQVVKKEDHIEKIGNTAIRDYVKKMTDDMAPMFEPDSWSDYGEFIVLEKGDSPTNVISDRFLENPFENTKFGDSNFIPTWEWSVHHEGFWEVSIILSDDGGFETIMIPDNANISPELMVLLEKQKAKED